MAYHFASLDTDRYRLTSRFRDTFENNNITISKLSGLLEEFNSENQYLNQQVAVLAAENRVLKRASQDVLQVRPPSLRHIPPSLLPPSIPAKYGYSRRERIMTDYDRHSLKKQYVKKYAADNPEPPLTKSIEIKPPAEPVQPPPVISKAPATITQPTQTEETPYFRPQRTPSPSPQRKPQQILRLLQSKKAQESPAKTHYDEASKTVSKVQQLGVNSEILHRTTSNTYFHHPHQSSFQSQPQPQPHIIGSPPLSSPPQVYVPPQFTFSKVIHPSVHHSVTHQSTFVAPPHKVVSYVQPQPAPATQTVMPRRQTMQKSVVSSEGEGKKRYLSLVSSASVNKIGESKGSLSKR